MEEEELEQDTLDNFDFVAGVTSDKDFLDNGSEESEFSSSSEDDSHNRRFKSERKHSEVIEDKTEEKQTTPEKKRKRTPSPLKSSPKEENKKEINRRDKRDGRDSTKPSSPSRHKDWSSKDKKRSGERERKRDRSRDWDHYEPEEDRNKKKVKEREEGEKQKRDIEEKTQKEKRNSSIEKERSPKRGVDFGEESGKENGDEDGETSQLEEKDTEKKEEKTIYQPKEEPYIPSDKYTNRRVSQFGEKAKEQIRINRPIKQASLSFDQTIHSDEQKEEQSRGQPRYQEYVTSRSKRNDQDKRRTDPFGLSNDGPNSDRLFDPKVYEMYSSYTNSNQSNHHSHPNHSNRSQINNPPDPSPSGINSLLPGVKPIQIPSTPVQPRQPAPIVGSYGSNMYTQLPPQSPQPVRKEENKHDRNRYNSQPSAITNEKVPQEILLATERRARFKTETSKVVIKRLSKYFKENRITTKEDFKHLSRKLAHKIMKKEETKGFFINQSTTKKIKKYIDAYFIKHTGVYVRKKREWKKPLPLEKLSVHE